jgi:hypothetical protein
VTLGEFKAKKEAIHAQQKALAEETEGLFRDQVVGLFEKWPCVVKIGWRQYTPYWNDGEPCTFRCNTEYAEFWFEGDDLEESDGESWWDADSVAKGSITQEQYDAYKEFHMVLDSFDKDDYLAMFDDHQTVTITRGGITVEEYDHD